jgi:hypothetical protein
MMSVLVSLLMTLRTWARSRASLQLEVLALRHQLEVLQRSRPRRVRLAKPDRWLWVVLSRVLTGWRSALVIVKPETVIAWHRRGFRLWWTWKSRRRIGRPAVPGDIRALIRTMAQANPRWGAPRIHGELLKLGIDVCQATVGAGRRRKPGAPSYGIMSARSSRPISSSSRPRPTASYGSERVSSCREHQIRQPQGRIALVAFCFRPQDKTPRPEPTLGVVCPGLARSPSALMLVAHKDPPLR